MKIVCKERRNTQAYTGIHRKKNRKLGKWKITKENY